MKAKIFFLTLMAPIYGVASSLTISGISSGGFMASQMATIYSDRFSGVATVAGGVYYCAENHFQEKLKEFGLAGFLSYGLTSEGAIKIFDPMNVSNSMSEEEKTQPSLGPTKNNPIYQSVGICMGHPEKAHRSDENNPMDLSFMRKLEDRGLIAETRNIRNQKVLIYQGKNDEVVRAPMAKKLKEFYLRMGVPEGSIQTIYSGGNHNFPTDKSEGIGCDEAKVPYIAKCNMDLAGKILTQTLRRSLQRGTMNEQNLYKVSQDGAPISIAPYGYLYANQYCLQNPKSCDLHVALHGCKMNDDFDQNFQNLYNTKIQMTRILGMYDYEMSARVPMMGAEKFAKNAGYAEYAEPEENHLMVYFPQTQITTENFPGNPNGCWDWFGWTGLNYATNKGDEPHWLIQQIQAIRSNPQGFIKTQK